VRRIVYWLLGTASVVTLAFAYRTSTEAVLPTTEVAADSASSSAADAEPEATATAEPGATASASPSSGSTASSGSSAATAVADGTYTGDAINTRFGPVQVEITVADGKVTAATAIEYPTRDRRDQEINEYAIPILNSEAAQAQTADIQWISGATYTTDGYVKSLQSALDKAGL